MAQGNKFRTKKIKKWMATMATVVCIFGMGLTVPAIAFAETEPTFETTEETMGVEAYVGVVNIKNLNVRVGFGADYDQLQYDGHEVILHEGDRIAVLSTGTSTSGYLWYEVRWMEDGKG